ncbi:hypothetical protein CIB84_014469 [Bambusicola thoracicus]|uniref:Uncharacterized protein n=1 Tax=Bambusicola thoracicus TaxID=9083 RepID=A0A2P4SCD3_BAMTH|nr:hypothetical protein CIB84_014469 [Bambusicola thoracicus]
MCLKVKETLADVLLVTSLEPVVEAPQQVSEIVQFTGRRLNSKMQVYSGSKPVCLSKMLTLYELCIRVLQNNIDLLHEVGGVPFEILEPVLTRCTPEQLFRVEECNPWGRSHFLCSLLLHLGRQVKMAYVTSAAKPLRNIRRQQGIHGTAGSVTQLRLTDKWK